MVGGQLKRKKQMSKETKTYWVTMRHEMDTAYTIQATSKKQVERLFAKMLQDGTVSPSGIDHNSTLMESIGEVTKGGPSVYDWPALRSLRYEGNSGERSDKIDEIVEG